MKAEKQPPVTTPLKQCINNNISKTQLEPVILLNLDFRAVIFGVVTLKVLAYIIFLSQYIYREREEDNSADCFEGMIKI